MHEYSQIEIAETGKALRQLLLVSPDMLHTVWPATIPLLMEGKKYWEDYSTIESIYAAVNEGKTQLWLMNDDEEFMLAMITEILKWPNHLELKIMWIGGRELNSAIQQFLDYMELWAARQGISKVKLSGRKAWTRKLLPFGYRVTEYVMEKDISGIKEH